MTSVVPVDSSLGRLVGLLEAHNPNLLKLLQATTEEEFVDATECALELAIRTIEGGAKRYSALDERGLSRLLADLLSLSGYHASAERDHNGHVDVIIENALGGRWKYLGECKIHKGFQYHVDGCCQLLGYCNGRELRAFALDFFKSPAMYDKLLRLREKFDESKPAGQSGTSSDHSIIGAFITKHTHSSGRTVQLLHFGCAVRIPV